MNPSSLISERDVPVSEAVLKRLQHLVEADERRAAFDPDQPRDDAGRWTDDDGLALDEDRAAASRETSVHRAADRHVKQLAIAFQHAFVVAKSTLRKTKDVDKTIASLRSALEQTLPNSLLRVVTAGGDAAIRQLTRELRDLSHKFSSTQIVVPQPLRDDVLAFCKLLIPESDLSGDGRETNPHVTVKYGITSARPTKLRDAIAAMPPVKVTLGKTNFFPAVSDGQEDVVFVEVLYPEALRELNELIAATVDTVSTYKEYHPHVTLAYVELGKGHQYAGHSDLQGREFTATAVQFSSKDDAVIELPLLGTELLRAAAKKRYEPNEAAADWAKKHAAELIDDVSETSERRIRRAIVSLVGGGDWEEAVDKIVAEVGDDDRAELIARHETYVAASEGQRQAWQQAVDDGVLSGRELRVWVAMGNPCKEICEGLDGQTAPLDGSFVDDQGDEYLGPPAHINCRCGEQIVSSLRDAEWNEDDHPRDERGRFTDGSTSGSLNDDHYNAIAAHITGPEVNYALRGEQEFTEENRRHLKLIDEAIAAQAPIKEGSKFFRAVSREDFDDFAKNPDRPNLGYISVSKTTDAIDRGIGENTGGEFGGVQSLNDWVVLEVEMGSGVKGFDVNETREFDDFNSFSTQEEVILERGLKIDLLGPKEDHVYEDILGEKTPMPSYRVRISKGD